MADHKLKLGSLTALVIGSMIGGGIFSLPKDMASGAEVGAILIGWAITAVGMLALAFVFQTLANRKPDLDNGVYTYAKAGFGNYLGFSSAWGYWISAWVGNVAYLMLLMNTLGYFFPALKTTITDPVTHEVTSSVSVWGIALASVLLWSMHMLVLRGVKTAAFINTIITIAKVIPLFAFIIILLFSFKLDIFTTDFWGTKSPDLGSVMTQVKSMMLVTVWVFIGIEGASVYSASAEKRTDVGKATILGFLSVLSLLVLVNVLSAGVMKQPELAGLENPSMAHVLAHVVGPWGATFISVGLGVSLLDAVCSRNPVCGFQRRHRSRLLPPRKQKCRAHQRAVGNQHRYANLLDFELVLCGFLSKNGGAGDFYDFDSLLVLCRLCCAFDRA